MGSDEEDNSKSGTSVAHIDRGEDTDVDDAANAVLETVLWREGSGRLFPPVREYVICETGGASATGTAPIAPDKADFCEDEGPVASMTHRMAEGLGSQSVPFNIIYFVVVVAIVCVAHSCFVRTQLHSLV